MSRSTTAPLQRFLDDALGDHVADHGRRRWPAAVRARCSRVDRGAARWVLRRAPRHASSATAHDVLREFRILDAIKDEPVAHRPPGRRVRRRRRVRRAVLRDGAHRRACRSCSRVPDAWAAAPETHGRALEELVDALVAIHAVDWRACGLGDLAHDRRLPGPPAHALARAARLVRRPRPARRAPRSRDWLDAHRPADQPSALCHGDYKLDNVLFAPEPPPRLLAVVDWEMAAIGDPLVDLAWALIFHPGPDGTMRSAWRRSRSSPSSTCPIAPQLVERYAQRSGRDTSAHRLVRRVRPLEARHRARRQLRQVPARPVRQADPRVLRDRRSTCCSTAPRAHHRRQDAERPDD